MYLTQLTMLSLLVASQTTGLWEAAVKAGHIPKVPPQRAKKLATTKLAESLVAGTAASSSHSPRMSFGFAGREVDMGATWAGRAYRQSLQRSVVH